MASVKDSNKPRKIGFLAFIFWVTFLISGWQFWMAIDSYHEGYRVIKPEGSPPSSGFPQGRYFINYVPDYPNPNDEVVVHITLNSPLVSPVICKKCILSGYYIGEQGNKLFLFKDEKVGIEGVAFKYPGKEVHIVMKYKDEVEEFYIPQPSLKQSAKLAIYNYPFISLLSILSGPIALILTIIGLITSFRNRKGET